MERLNKFCSCETCELYRVNDSYFFLYGDEKYICNKCHFCEDYYDKELGEIVKGRKEREPMTLEHVQKVAVFYLGVVVVRYGERRL